MDSTTRENHVRRLYESFNAHLLDPHWLTKVMGFLSERVVIEDTATNSVFSEEKDIKAFFTSKLTAYPDLQITICNIEAYDENQVLSKCIATGSFTGQMLNWQREVLMGNNNQISFEFTEVHVLEETDEGVKTKRIEISYNLEALIEQVSK